MGTPEFAVPSLSALASVADVVAVFSRPDAVSGRGRAARPAPVTLAARELGLSVVQPPTLRDPVLQQQIAALQADLIVVAAYGLILPEAVLSAARLGAINVHASLLPRWRGAAPIQRAILAGDVVTGVSIMRMETGLDTGPYCSQVETEIGDATAAELTDRLAQLGADALIASLPTLASGAAQWVVQEESLVTYADKILKPDVILTPELTVADAVRRVRASLPAAPCRATVADKGVTVIAARNAAPDLTMPPPAGVVARHAAGPILGLRDGAILVERIKPDGKSEMSAADWARGVRDLDHARWGAPA
jgi:methionyl-tRNA formyltransferase